MPVTLSTILSDVRSRLDETTARMWTDAELTTWINEGLRDVARRTETIEFNVVFPATVGTPKFALPSDVLRVHRVEFLPNNTGIPQVYPLQLATLYEMDQWWGSTQFQQRAYPSFAAFYGRPPNIVMQVYPVPSQTGAFNVYYYKLPLQLTATTQTAEISEGWFDVVESYCEYMALRKDHDPRWQEAKQLYEEAIVNLIDVSRKHHDQAGSFVRSPSGNFDPYGTAGGWY